MAGLRAAVEMWFKKHRRASQTVLAASLCFVILYAFLIPDSSLHLAKLGSASFGQSFTSHHNKWPDPTTLKSLSLTEKQCTSTFPGLFKEIDHAIEKGPFLLRQTDSMVQGRIRDGELFIISAERRVDLSQDTLKRRSAALHQLHRALITSPEPLPDTVFGLNIGDSPVGQAFSYSRAIVDPRATKHSPSSSSSSSPSLFRSFPMPHFAWWAWDLSFVGSMRRAMSAVEAVEAEYERDGGKRRRKGGKEEDTAWFEAKDPRAVWRGTTWFNSPHNPNLRGKLLQATKGKAWADVEALNWTRPASASSDSGRKGGGGGSGYARPKEATNGLQIEDFCRHRYVVHTEGVTYSGRFQLHQLCASVVLSPPLDWMQHTTHLSRPVWSTDLLASSSWPSSPSSALSSGPDSPNSPPTAPDSSIHAHPTPHHVAMWPAVSRTQPSDATMVFVAPDFSDLEATVMWLEAHPAVAARIARNQRELFVRGGYFSPAAESCYWRRLLRGWSEVVMLGGRYSDEEGGDGGVGTEWDEGTPWEVWVVREGNI